MVIEMRSQQAKYILTLGRKCSTTNRSLSQLQYPEAIYPLKFYSGSSMFPATVWIIFTRILNLRLKSQQSCLVQLFNGFVAIGNPERHVRKASHRGSKQQQRSCSQSLLLLLARPTYIMVLFFTHIPFVVNHTINARPPATAWFSYLIISLYKII